MKKRFDICGSLVLRNKEEPFLHRIVTCDWKQIICDNRKHSASWFNKDEAPKHSPKSNIHQKKLMVTWFNSLQISSSSSSWLWLLAEFSKWPYLHKVITLIHMRNIQVQLEQRAAIKSVQRRKASKISSTLSSPASSQA